MAMRIRVLAGCFAMGVTALLLTGTAAQATPQSGAHVGASAVADGNPTAPATLLQRLPDADADAVADV